MNLPTNAIRILKGLAGVFLALWPFLIFFGLRQDQFRFVLYVTLFVLIVRLFVVFCESTTRKWHALLSPILGMILVAVALMIDKLSLALWYPVVVNGCFFLMFFGSLLKGTPIVQQFAQMMSKEESLPEQAVRYTRRVTEIWSGFFVINGAIATLTILNGDIEVWTLYNGFISYLLIAALMGSEYLYRKKVLHV